MQRNKILCFFATIIIAAVTIYVVFRGGGVSFGQLAESIKEASVPGSYFPVSVCLALSF